MKSNGTVISPCVLGMQRRYVRTVEVWGYRLCGHTSVSMRRRKPRNANTIDGLIMMVIS
jgi:hypothetical protein